MLTMSDRRIGKIIQAFLLPLSSLKLQTFYQQNDEKKNNLKNAQVISIMPNPRARRGSIANAAFPELHHQVAEECIFLSICICVYICFCICVTSPLQLMEEWP